MATAYLSEHDKRFYVQINMLSFIRNIVVKFKIKQKSKQKKSTGFAWKHEGSSRDIIRPDMYR